MQQRLDSIHVSSNFFPSASVSTTLTSPSSSPQESRIPGLEHPQPGFVSVAQPRLRRSVRSQTTIVAAILEACRTPTVQHWVMVKARLGYETFWHHMNQLLYQGLMDEVSEGNRTLYRINAKGLQLLSQLNEV